MIPSRISTNIVRTTGSWNRLSIPIMRAYIWITLRTFLNKSDKGWIGFQNAQVLAILKIIVGYPEPIDENGKTCSASNIIDSRTMVA